MKPTSIPIRSAPTMYAIVVGPRSHVASRPETMLATTFPSAPMAERQGHRDHARS